MLEKTIDLLKNNPAIILLYTLLSAIFLGIRYLQHIMSLNDFVSTLLIYILLVLLIAGLGNMIKEALQNGKTSPKTFIPGIMKYSIRVFLSFLLLYLFHFLLAIAQHIILSPFSLLNYVWDPIFTNIAGDIIIYCSNIIAIPFVALLPTSIIIDDTSVIHGLKNSFNAGTNNYLKLLFVAIVYYIPTIIFDTIVKLFHFTGYNIDLFSFFANIPKALLGFILVPLLFTIYFRTSIQNEDGFYE